MINSTPMYVNIIIMVAEGPSQGNVIAVYHSASINLVQLGVSYGVGECFTI
jgi:hypothetical protein